MNRKPEIITEPAALEALTRAEIDVQVATAKKYPRDIASSIDRAKQLMCLDHETAEECIYMMPRGGKTIEGPSVRCAEILASAWGNLRVAARIMEIGQKDVTCAGVCQDLESNLTYIVDVKRRITHKNGSRYSDDMILTTANAACSIAHRNATLKAIPRALWLNAYNAVKEKARKGRENDPLEQRRRRAIAWFAQQGVSTHKVLKRLGRNTISDINEDDLLVLTGMRNAITQDGMSIDEVFENGEKRTETVKLNDILSPENYQDPKVPEMTEEEIKAGNGKYAGIFNSPSEKK